MRQTLIQRYTERHRHTEKKIDTGMYTERHINRHRDSRTRAKVDIERHRDTQTERDVSTGTE